MRQRGQDPASPADSPQDNGRSHDAQAASDPKKCDDSCSHQQALVGEPMQHGKRPSGACRTFLLSPYFKLIVLSIVSFVPIFGTFLFVPEFCRVIKCEGFAQVKYYVVIIWFSVQFIYNFAMSQFTNPGGTNLVKPTFEVTGQFQMVCGDDQNDEKFRQINSKDPLMYAPNFCEHCKDWKPPRAHHCGFCRRCVLRMDHHCPFTGNCIGLRNHGHFVLMYLFAMTGLATALAMGVFAIWSSDGTNGMKLFNGTSRPSLLVGMTSMFVGMVMQLLAHCSVTVAVHTAGCVIASIAVLSFGSPALYHAFSGQTMLEVMFPMKEYVQIKQSVYCPLGSGFYNRGWKRNVRDLLGPRWWLRLLLPVRGAPLDPRVAVAPRPSDAGIEALLGRIKQVEAEGVAKTVESAEALGINPGPAAEGNVV